MYRSLRLLSAILISIIFACGTITSASDKDDIINDPGVKAAIDVFDVWVKHRVYKEEIPGVSIGIVYDQQLIWSKGYGYTDLQTKDPTTTATAYRIASLTKLFTATAILQLRDAGKLQLDDPVAKHLDWFRLNDEHSDSPVITIRHLLTHTSGVIREFDQLYWDNMDFPDRDTFIKMFQESSSILPRGEKIKYSNVAYAILGFVVEVNSGVAYSDFVTDNILTPLEMNSTEVLPSPQMEKLATGYKIRKPGQPRVVEPFLDSKAMAAAANIASTSEDLGKFLSLQFRNLPGNDSQILKSSTIKEMHRVQWLDEKWSYGRGLGWGVVRVDNQTRISHGGYVNGFTSSISAVPTDKFGVVVLTNADDGAPSNIANQIWKIVAPAVKKSIKPEDKPKEADSSWEKYVGVYEGGDGAFLNAMILDNELALVDPASSNPWSTRIKLEFVEGNTFKMTNRSQEGEKVIFGMNENGEVNRIIMPGYAYQRQ